MALSTIRRFTPEDQARLDASAHRFIERHGLAIRNAWTIEEMGAAAALDQEIWARSNGTDPRVPELKRLWQACRCRALGVPVEAGISVAFGFIGRSC